PEVRDPERVTRPGAERDLAGPAGEHHILHGLEKLHLGRPVRPRLHGNHALRPAVYTFGTFGRDDETSVASGQAPAGGPALPGTGEHVQGVPLTIASYDVDRDGSGRRGRRTRQLDPAARQSRYDIAEWLLARSEPGIRRR